jgi:hypothetical protein
VEYENENEAEDALEGLLEKDFDGKPLNIGKNSLTKL